MMSRVMKTWIGLVLVALVGLATVSIGAQGVAPMSAERSYSVQAQLRAIDQKRAAFVDELLRQWANYVDPYMYDLQTELRPIAMQVPAWQLYGASLVGDFPTMMRVLRGVEGAGPYINAIATPQARTAYAPLLSTSDVGTYALGSSTDQLVFVPIAPCRMVDTRLAGAKTGILAANTSRSFDLTTSGLAEGQGSAASCTGLPSYSYYAWAVNITVTGYSGSGWLVAWPYAGTEPTSSVANYGTGVYALASGQTLTGCLGCGEDIVVKAYNAATHVIIDVVGYYRDAGVGSATVTRVVGDVEVVAASNSLYIDGGVCPAGTVLIGGEVDHAENDVAVSKTVQFSSTQWRFWMKNNSAAGVTVTGYSRCMDQPIQVF
jgi:hypothetical protein